ncbi:hypothetical protein V8E51_002916 [Hyaloscypha variabilis]
MAHPTTSLSAMAPASQPFSSVVEPQLNVSSNRVPFTICKELITKHSRLTLDDVESSIFGHFVHWLHTEEIGFENSDGHTLSLIQKAKLLIFAYKYINGILIRKIHEQIMDHDLPEDERCRPLAEFQKWAYNKNNFGLMANIIIQSLVMRKTISHITPENMYSILENMPPPMAAEYVEDLTREMLDLKDLEAEEEYRDDL